MSTGTFPDELKIADIALLSKRRIQMIKLNYRTISLLPLISKIFEKVFYQHIEDFITKSLWIQKRPLNTTYSSKFAEKTGKVFG